MISLGLKRYKDQNQTVLVAIDNSTVVAYINKQGGTHSAEMCALLWKIMTWCHHYQITLRAMHIPCDLPFQSNEVQSTEWSLHLQVFKQICQKLFTPHADLFATPGPSSPLMQATKLNKYQTSFLTLSVGSNPEI